MSRIHYFQHVPFEGLGRIEHWTRLHGHSVTVTRFYESHPFPPPSDYDWLIIMGGPMSAYEDDIYPRLVEEKRAISQAIQAGKTVLGICLGAQLLAAVLGARVYPHRQKEIGWYPVKLTSAADSARLCVGLPGELTVFHWHGDTFDIPTGAVHLAESAVCPHQAFLYGDRVLALQFHLEATPAAVDGMVANGGHELNPASSVQSGEEILDFRWDYRGINSVLECILDCLDRKSRRP